MLAGVLHDLGDALMAMTAEEVAEALAMHDADPEEDDDDVVLVESERMLIRAAATPGLRAFRRGMAHAKVRAGKTLSTETIRCMREAKAMHEDAMDLHRQAMRKHKDGIAAVNDMFERAGVSDEDSDATQTVQTSDGVTTDEGSRAAHCAAQRQADLLAIPASI
jgi:urease gamma subunit